MYWEIFNADDYYLMALSIWQSLGEEPADPLKAYFYVGRCRELAVDSITIEGLSDDPGLCCLMAVILCIGKI